MNLLLKNLPMSLSPEIPYLLEPQRRLSPLLKNLLLKNAKAGVASPTTGMEGLAGCASGVSALETTADATGVDSARLIVVPTSTCIDEPHADYAFRSYVMIATADATTAPSARLLAVSTSTGME